MALFFYCAQYFDEILSRSAQKTVYMQQITDATNSTGPEEGEKD